MIFTFFKNMVFYGFNMGPKGCCDSHWHASNSLSWGPTVYWGGLQTADFGSVSARAQYVSHIISILFPYYFHIASILFPYYYHIFLEKYENGYGINVAKNGKNMDLMVSRMWEIMEKIWNTCGKMWKDAYRRNMEYI